MKSLILFIFALMQGASMVAVAAERASSEKFKTQHSKIKKQQQGRLIVDSDYNEASNETHHYNITLQEATVSSVRKEAGTSTKNTDLRK